MTQKHGSIPDVRSVRSAEERITRAMLGAKDPVAEQGGSPVIRQRDVLTLLFALAVSAGACAVLLNAPSEHGIHHVRAEHVRTYEEIHAARRELAQLRALRGRDRH